MAPPEQGKVDIPEPGEHVETLFGFCLFIFKQLPQKFIVVCMLRIHIFCTDSCYLNDGIAHLHVTSTLILLLSLQLTPTWG